MQRIILAMMAGLSLAGCLPILQGVPERLTPRYLGTEAASVNMNCAQTNEYLFILGPHEVRLRVSPKYFPERRLGILQMRLVALGPRQAMLESQDVVVVPVEGGQAASVRIVSGMDSPQKTHDFEVRIENLPSGPILVGLPVILIGAETWRPADLELRPKGATLRPMPFNC